MANGKNPKQNGNGGKATNGVSTNGRRSTPLVKNGGNGGNLSRSITSTPARFDGANYRPLNTASQRLKGSEYVGKLRVGPTTATSELIKFSASVSPSAYPGTRLTQMAALWERYRINSFTVRYVPAVPFTLACQLVCYIDTDPLDDPKVISDPAQLIRQALAQAGSQQWNFNSSKTIPFACRSDNQLYYTGSSKLNDRFSSAGNIFILQITEPIDYNGQAITADFDAGSIFVDWDITFQIAQINPIPVTAFSPPEIKVVNLSPLPIVGTFYKIGGLQPFTNYALTSVASINYSGSSIVLQLAPATTPDFEYKTDDRYAKIRYSTTATNMIISALDTNDAVAPIMSALSDQAGDIILIAGTVTGTFSVGSTVSFMLSPFN